MAGPRMDRRAVTPLAIEPRLEVGDERHWPRSRRSLWMPLVVVIVSLAVLVAAPILVGARLRHIRRSVSDVVDQSRDLTSDIEAALAREVIDAGADYAASSDSAAQQYAAAVRDEHRRAVALGPLVETLGPDMLEPFAEYREATARWHEDVDRSGRFAPLRASNATVRREAAAQALDAALRLDAMLARDRTAMLERAHTLEEADVLLPVALVPIALLGCILALRAGRRTAMLAEEAERGRSELRRVLEERAAMMRGITHDLKNPLGAALGFIDLIRDDQLAPAERQNALGRVRRLLRASLDTVSGMLDLARSDVGAVDFIRVPVDLVALARACVEDDAETARRRGQTLTVAEPTGAVIAMADPQRARAAVENLLSNALKYTPPNGRITLSAHRGRRDDREFAVLSVVDSGPGIPAELRERVFEEFYRVPSLQHVAPGSGIGLAMSRRVARMMGGDIRIEEGAADVTGTTISLWLPIAHDSVAAANSRRAPIAAAPRPRAGVEPRR